VTELTPGAIQAAAARRDGANAALSDLPPPPPRTYGWPWTAVNTPGLGSPADGQSWPKITIITPSFNQGRFIEETIRSVLLQNYPNLEYFVYDAGSSDGSVQTIRTYEPWLSFWVSEQDRGQAHAINRGLARASGEIIAWLNSDDTYRPGALAAAAAAAARYPDAAVVYADANWVDTDGRLLRSVLSLPYDRHYLLREANCIPQSSAFLRRRAFLDAGGLDESLHFAMDYDLWLKLGQTGHLVHVPEVWSHARIHAAAKTSSGDIGYSKEVERVARKHGGSGLPSGHRQWMEEVHLRRAFDAYRTGDSASGERALMYLADAIPTWRSADRLGELIARHSWQVSPGLTGDDDAILKFASTVCANLPARFAAKRATRRALGPLHQSLAFRSYGRGARRAFFTHALQAIRNEPGCVGNRGLWSLATKSWRGHRGSVDQGDEESPGAVRQEILQWVGTLRSDRLRPFVICGDSAGAVDEFASSCLAALIMALCNGLDACTAAELTQWQRFVQSHQDPLTGLFTDPLSTAHEAKEWWLTHLAIAALRALGGTYRYPLAFVTTCWSESAAYEWLAGQDWRAPDAGWMVATLLLGLLQEFERTADEINLAAAQRVLDWFDHWQNPNTGCWEPVAQMRLADRLGLASLLAPAYFTLRRTVRFADRIVDSALAMQEYHGLFSERGDAATDLNAINLLVKLSRRANPSRARVEAACRFATAAIWRCKRTGRGFGDLFSGSSPAAARGGVANLEATWCRVLSLALIEDSRAEDAEHGSSTMWRFVPAPAVGWHDPALIAAEGV
jgi:glycosyl transferase family 2